MPTLKEVLVVGAVFTLIALLTIGTKHVAARFDPSPLDRFHLRVVTPALRGEPLVVDLGNAQWLVVSDYAVVSDAELRTLIRDSRRGDLRAWSVVQRDGGVAE